MHDWNSLKILLEYHLKVSSSLLGNIAFTTWNQKRQFVLSIESIKNLNEILADRFLKDVLTLHQIYSLTKPKLLRDNDVKERDIFYHVKSKMDICSNQKWKVSLVDELLMEDFHSMSKSFKPRSHSSFKYKGKISKNRT